jgi:hypothetical protein
MSLLQIFNAPEEKGMRGRLTMGAIALAIGAALFFAGRWTGPKPGPDYKRERDSLERDLRDARRILKKEVERANHNDILAETWYQKFVSLEKQKTVIRTIYNNDLKNISRLNSRGIDSAFVARYGADSIK